MKLSQFRQWQRDTSRHIAQPSDASHHCQCCQSDFVGNFCPQCGQKASVGRIGWQSVRQGFSMLWGLDSRSLPYTLWQLFLRPGYLIGDYISGKRQVSFPPIKMLALVAVFVYLCLNSMSMLEEENEMLEGYTLLNYTVNFFSKHLDVGVLFFFSSFIVPTYFIFRFAPRCTRHNLPEGLFIQVFDSTKALLWLLLITVLALLFNNEPMADDVGLLIVMALCVTYRSYHQLFGYGYWGTLWRTLSVFFAAWLVLIVFFALDYIITQMVRGELALALTKFVNVFLPYFLSLVCMLAVPYFISRRTARRSSEKGKKE